jgi:hypothetical protein
MVRMAGMWLLLWDPAAGGGGVAPCSEECGRLHSSRRWPGNGVVLMLLCGQLASSEHVCGSC